MKNILFILIAIIISGCVGIQKSEFGVKDSSVENKIKNANTLISLYHNQRYEKIEKVLISNIKKYSNDKYALIRIYNELAQLYSFNLLDIEKAIDMDKKLSSLGYEHPNSQSDYKLNHTAANNILLTSKWYQDKFVDISDVKIKELSDKRLKTNTRLMSAKISSSKIYSKEKLIKVLKISNKNYNRTYPNTQDRYLAISKIIKREYELYRTTKNLKYINAYKYINNNEISLNNIFLDEIDFLSLSNFFLLSFKKTNNIKLAEYGLHSIYKPYTNIRDEQHRLAYNSLVNKYINTLIDASYTQKIYKDMLYYISLNKSRMISEDLIRNSNRVTNLSSQKNTKNIDLKTGLPQKDFFTNKILGIDAYLDFYVKGDYITKDVSLHQNDIKNSDTRTRSYVINKKTKKVEKIQEFKGEVTYITYVSNGKIKVNKITTKDTSLIKKHLDRKYKKLIHFNNINTKPSYKILKKLIPFNIKNKIHVSTDKFISKYPLSYFLDKDVIKTTNLFTLDLNNKPLEDINIVGYFNPTSDLPGSEAEINLIQNSFNDLKVFKRESATLKTLKKNINRNILHLSMHGKNDNINPQNSMLMFSGSIKNGRIVNESHSLKAENMNNFNQLKNNELIFTAACETGLTKESKNNESEIEGILRPLLINNNKNIILTLWEVEDNSSKDFVNYFYSFLSKNKNIKESFLLAKNKLKLKYKNPIFWAPYYLIQN